MYKLLREGPKALLLGMIVLVSVVHVVRLKRRVSALEGTQERPAADRGLEHGGQSVEEDGKSVAALIMPTTQEKDDLVLKIFNQTLYESAKKKATSQGDRDHCVKVTSIQVRF